MKIPPPVCKFCAKSMSVVFGKEPPHYLEGWSCDCSHTEPAIWRERRITRGDYGDQTRSSGHMVQQGGEVT
jgi:hypothetical protein